MAVSAVTVLNADFSFLGFVVLKKAIRMLVREVAEIHESTGENFGPFQKPLVVRLIKYVVAKWQYRSGGPKWSRIKVLKRDGYKCGYCAGKAVTIDHVLPKSRGGANSWLNCVACCLSCNNKKADKTPKEAHMTLLVTPRVPTWAEIVQM